MNLLPVHSKTLVVSATFYCREIFDVIGMIPVKVEAARPPEPETNVTNVNQSARKEVKEPLLSETSSRVTFLA